MIIGAARTPIGAYGGALRDVHPAELGAVAARAALARAGIPAADVDEVLIGQARQAGAGPNPGRQVAYRAGIPDAVPAQTINKACASSLQAIASGAQSILLGESAIVLAGGIESMSRMPYLVDAADARWGRRMGAFTLVDAMYRDGFTCGLSGLLMGETAELLARQYHITREESDSFAFESQRKTRQALEQGRFDAELAAVDVPAAGGVQRAARDEHPRPDTSLDTLRRLPPAFAAAGAHGAADGIVTAGSSSGITDGGAVVLLASAARVREQRLAPRARILGWASAGVDPKLMGIGPVFAIHKLFARTGLTMDDFDLIEINEAFAAQVLACLKEIPVPADRLNVNGGAIALGHPIGATGARMVVTLLYELERRGAKRGLAALCVSGGMGMAMAIEVI
jgi:acetyl-CoA C-acetyltransferase